MDPTNGNPVNPMQRGSIAVGLRWVLACVLAAVIMLQGCAMVPGYGSAAWSDAQSLEHSASEPAAESPAPEDHRELPAAIAILAFVILTIALSRAVARDVVKSVRIGKP